MKFYGVKKVITHDENYGQMQAMDEFWAQMKADYPGLDFVSVGKDWSDNTLNYYIGQIDHEWRSDLETVELPDDDWKEFQCPLEDEAIEKLYREIWDEGKLDYEIEELTDDTLTVRAHYAKEKE